MGGFEHVLWIGGGCGSGKTAVGRWLAHRHDLRAYNSDAYMLEHHRRSLAGGNAAARRWERMSPDERWVTMDTADMAELSLELNAEKFHQMVADVRALPRSPSVVVEGTPLLPWLVEEHLASSEQAVWLIPRPEFQRARLRERPTTTYDATSDPPRALANRIEREIRVTAAIERAAEERGYTILRVDETQDLVAVQAAVEKAFAPLLARGPRASSDAERRELRRSENATVLRQLRAYLAEEPRAGAAETVTFPFSCECGASGCGAQASETVARYEELVHGGQFLVSPAHAS